MPLEPGDKAPDFTLLDQHGQPFSLKKSLDRLASLELDDREDAWR
jgi:peroxiredoxin